MTGLAITLASCLLATPYRDCHCARDPYGQNPSFRASRDASFPKRIAVWTGQVPIGFPLDLLHGRSGRATEPEGHPGFGSLSRRQYT